MTPRVDLHPASIKHIKKGHPWITLDSFSSRFPKNSYFLGSRLDEENFVILINDPSHPNVKARVWKIDTKSRIEKKDFIYEMIGRLQTSLDIRFAQNLNRENFYLVFGEADQLPGLHILKLKDDVLVQFYAEFWQNFEKEIVKFLEKNNIAKRYWVQRRNKNQEVEFYCFNDKNIQESEFELKEFDVNYKIRINKYYDIGIYTDMSGIRNKIQEEFKDKKVLNLYCYTGAYSVNALKNGASQVTSIDLSKKYLAWLDENLALNPDLDKSKHTSIEASALQGMDQLIKKGEEFDLIICDPPSASSDGKKTTAAIDSYKDLIIKIEKLLTKKGKAYLFLNTHSVTRKSFEDKIKKYTEGLPLVISGSVKLTEDCPSLKGFIEGDYLKGITILKK